jgi:hypothetical protein
MRDKVERIKYGKAAEEALYVYLAGKIRHRIELSDQMPDWSPEFDMRNGDIFVDIAPALFVKIDVKRMRRSREVWISENSIMNFAGDFFALVPVWDVTATKFVPARTIASYYAAVKRSGNAMIHPESKEPGFLFKTWKLRAACAAESFVDSMNGMRC